jgi:hypothetical protein
MEIIIKAVIIKGLKDIDTFPIRVNDKKFLLVKKRLELEYANAVNILKNLKKEGKIKSIWIPTNKKIQKDLNDLVKAKKTIKESIGKLREFY